MNLINLIYLMFLIQIFLNSDPKKVSLIFILLTINMVIMNNSSNIFWLNYFIMLLFLSGIFVILTYLSGLSNFMYFYFSYFMLMILVFLFFYMNSYNYIYLSMNFNYFYFYLIILFINSFIFLMFLINLIMNYYGSLRKF